MSPNNLQDLIYAIEQHSTISEYCSKMPKKFVDPRLLAGWTTLPEKQQYEQMKAFMDNITTTMNQHKDPSNWNDADRSSLERSFKFIKETTVPMHLMQGGAAGAEDEYVQMLIDEITIQSIASTTVEFAMEDFHSYGLIIPDYDIELLRNVQYGSGLIASLMFCGIAAYEPCGGSSSQRQFLRILSELFEDM